MRRLVIFTAILLLLQAPTFGQQRSGGSSGPGFSKYKGAGPSLPASCQQGDLFFLTLGSPGYYQGVGTSPCAWSQLSGGGGGVTTTGSPASGQFALLSGASTLTGSNNFTFSDSPSLAISRLGNNAANVASQSSLLLYGYGNSSSNNFPFLAFNAGRGTAVSRAATQSGDKLGQVWFYGFGNSATDGAMIQAVARSLWTSSNAESALEFYTAKSGTLSSALTGAFSLDSSNNPTLLLYGSPTSQKGGVRFNNTTLKTQFSHDGSAWSDLGGGGTPGGSDGEPQFNNAGAFAGMSGLQWSSSLRYLADDQNLNSAVGLSVTNAHAGNAAASELSVGASGYSLLLSQQGAGFTTSGAQKQGGSYLASNAPGGLSIAATDAVGTIAFYTGGSASGNMRMTISNTGVLTQHGFFQIGGNYGASINGGLQIRTGGVAVMDAGYTTLTTTISAYDAGKVGLNIQAKDNNTASVLVVKSGSGGTGNLLEAQNSSGSVLFAARPDAALAIYNGTAPSSSVTDGVLLYSEDASSSAELKVRDEAGNVTTLSPHNFSLFQPDPSDPAIPFSYYSKNPYAGKEINVDWLGALRALERETGKQFVYVNDLPASEIRDWNADEETRRLEREKQRADWATRKAAREKEQADFDKLPEEQRKAGQGPADFTEQEPESYTKKPEPAYITARKGRPAVNRQREARFNLVSYTSPVIDAKSAGRTRIFATDDDRGNFYPVSVMYVCESGTAITTPATLTVGTAAKNLSTLAGVPVAPGASKLISLTDTFGIPPGTPVRAEVTVPSAGGAHTVRVVVVGFYQ